MTTNVYSKQLYEGVALGAATYTSAAVPTGYVWVVREVIAINRAVSPIQVLGGLRVSHTGGACFFETGMNVTTGDRIYHQVMRFVLSAGATMAIVVREAGWDLGIMGYQLSLP